MDPVKNSLPLPKISLFSLQMLKNWLVQKGGGPVPGWVIFMRWNQMDGFCIPTGMALFGPGTKPRSLVLERADRLDVDGSWSISPFSFK